MKNEVFKLPVRVYYEDTDCAGVVYYANYLKFMERARTEFLRTLGFELTTLEQNDQAVFVVRSVSVEYLKPARLNDLLSVSAVPREMGRSTLVFQQQVRHADTDSLLVDATVQLVCIHCETLKPIRMPQAIKDPLCALLMP